jgi:hypothetical protein
LFEFAPSFNLYLPIVLREQEVDESWEAIQGFCPNVLDGIEYMGPPGVEIMSSMVSKTFF